MSYTPDWEPLAAGLQRVVATGVLEEEAKIDLCRAIADGKVSVRVRIASSDHAMPERVFFGENIRTPPHLHPPDFDWFRSRPHKPWPIGPKLVEHYFWSGGWEPRQIDLIELSTVNVINVLCGRTSPHRDQWDSAPKTSLGAKTRGIAEAIRQLWPNGIIPNGLSAKERNRAIIDRMRQDGSSIPIKPERAIQRVLKILQSK